jgi:hypothetical protein
MDAFSEFEFEKAVGLLVKTAFSGFQFLSVFN